MQKITINTLDMERDHLRETAVKGAKPLKRFLKPILGRSLSISFLNLLAVI